MKGGSRNAIGLAGAVCALVILYVGSGGPIPIMTYYQETVGLSQGDLSMASTWYLLGTVVSLLFFPRLSDHLGRRPVVLMTLVLAFVGCCMYTVMDSSADLMVGRLVQGVASGLGSSATASYVVEMSSDLPKWVGPAITSSATTIGLSIGTFSSGGIQQFTDLGPSVFFEVVIFALVIIAVAVVAGRETVPRKEGAIGSLRPRLAVPRSAYRMFAASAVIFVGTWSINGFFQSFSSSVVEDSLGGSSAFIAAVIFAALLAPSIFGGIAGRRMDTRSAQRVGYTAFVVCTAGVCAAMWMGNLFVLAVVLVIAGFCQGIAFTGSVNGLLSEAGVEGRAGMFSMIYLVSFGGSAIPNFVVGLLPDSLGLQTIFTGYLVMEVVFLAVMLISSARPYSVGDGDPGTSTVTETYS